MTSTAADLLEWRAGRESTCAMKVVDIPWEDARAWRSDGDRLAHESTPVPASEFTTWATLGDIVRLLAVPGGCSNELRSTLSLLLGWR